VDNNTHTDTPLAQLDVALTDIAPNVAELNVVQADLAPDDAESDVALAHFAPDDGDIDVAQADIDPHDAELDVALADIDISLVDAELDADPADIAPDAAYIDVALADTAPDAADIDVALADTAPDAADIDPDGTVAAVVHLCSTSHGYSPRRHPLSCRRRRAAPASQRPHLPPSSFAVRRPWHGDAMMTSCARPRHCSSKGPFPHHHCPPDASRR